MKAAPNKTRHKKPPSELRTAWTPPELARAWGVAPESIVALIRQGRLPALNIGLKRRPRWLVTVDDLAVFRQRNQSSKAPAPRRKRKKFIDDGETFGF